MGDLSRPANCISSAWAPAHPAPPRIVIAFPLFAVMAAIAKKLVGMGFLKVVATNLMAGNLRGDSQHRHAAAVAIVKPVDQVHITRPATSGANRQFAR